MNRQHTTDEIVTLEGPFVPEESALRFLDIHIYDQEPEPEGPPSVEGHLEAEEASHDEREQEDTESRPAHQKRRTILALCLSLVSVALVGLVVGVFVHSLMTPDATITIVPITQQVRTTTSITVTTGQVTGVQLQGRALAALTMNQARTVPTTGTGHQDAKAGQGYITFYNAAPYPQTITAGTLLTGADGVQVVTDQDAIIAAVKYPTLGQTTVAAHALVTGPVSNIIGGDIYGPCCRLNVSAVSGPFTGGQQARDYPTVTSHDISTVTSGLKTGLDQSVQAALQTQVHSDETLITPLPCQEQVKADHHPGDEAAQVTILVSETCTGMTYPTQAYQNRLTQIANQQATNQLGEGYTSVGQVQSTILHARALEQNPTELLQVTLAETYAYQVSHQQQQEIKTRIAGETKTQATRTLLHIPGIQSVSVSSATIPIETNHIRVNMRGSCVSWSCRPHYGSCAHFCSISWLGLVAN